MKTADMRARWGHGVPPLHGSAGKPIPRESRSAGKPIPRRGFTLIELLTVVGIMVVILAVVGPAVSSILKGNAQKEATNAITAYLASARAMALNYKTPVGVVFYEDPSNPYQTAVQYVELTSWSGQAGSTTSQMKLGALGGATQEYLPRNIKVATLSDVNTTGSFSTEATAGGGGSSGGTPAGCRVVLFDGSGQMMLVNNLQIDPSPSAALPGSPTAGNTAWGMGTGTTSSSSPALCVYDGVALSGATSLPNFDMNKWLEANADVIVVNGLTGNVIR